MYCIDCKYDLRGLGDLRHCPECGRRFNPERPRTYRPSPDAAPVSSRHDTPSDVRVFVLIIFGFLATVIVAIIAVGVLRGLLASPPPAAGATLYDRTIINRRAPAYVLTICGVLLAPTLIIAIVGIRRRQFPPFLLGALAGLLAALLFVFGDLLMQRV